LLQAFLNSLKIEDVRNKIILTLGLIAVYRLGCHIVVPGVDPELIAQRASAGGWLELANMFSGGAFSRFAIFSLGIMPYISASIMMQLLTAVIPKLEELKKQGQQGQDKINQYTRYLTVALSTIQGLGLAYRASQVTVETAAGMQPVAPQTWGFRIVAMLTFTSGAVFIMWLGEQISEYGIGNGMSLLIYVAIITQINTFVINVIRGGAIGEFGPVELGALFTLLVALFVACVWIQSAERRVPIQYARQVQGRKVKGGQGSHLPLKVDYSGVIAVIFASSVMLVPPMIYQFTIGTQATPGWISDFFALFQRGSLLWAMIFAGLIIFFCYFYTAITFNPSDIAENLKESGGIIPGRRPGKNTAEFIDKILTRITLVGAVVVALIAIFPIWMSDWFDVQLYFGGTSLLILVGVGLDFVQKLESQLLMRNYEGFLDSGKVKGRYG
jgi:preprotein translocase subunit SecY